MFGSHPIHAGAFDLEARLIDFDPRLQLRYVTREHPTRKGVIGRRYEVHRHCEDGETRMIGHWKLEDFDKIWPDIQAMKAGAEGTAPGVEAEIEKHNAAVEAKISDQIRDNLGGAMEYAAKLFHDRTNPRNVFRGIPGLRDEPKPAPQEGADS